MRSSVVAILLVGLCAGAAQADQAHARSPAQARPTSRFERLERWFVAVARHRPGRLDAIAIEIASWPEEHIDEVVDDVGELSRFLLRAHVRLKRTGQQSASAHLRGRTLSLDDVQRLLGLTDDEAARGDVGRLAVRAAMLHTDITAALDDYDSLIRSRPRSAARTALLVADGRQEGIANRGPHWELARSLLDLIPPDSPRAGRRRDWYIAAAAVMHGQGRLVDLLPHVTKATHLFPAEPDLLVYGGAMHETFASPSIQQAIRGLSPPRASKAAVSDAGVHLRQARSFFERALACDADHLEARVRLGHVLSALGDDESAAGELERALTGGQNRSLHYYAALFLGGIHARAGRRDEARRLYERAASLYPRAQSPRLGLSSLARAAGDQTAATKALVDWLPSRDDGDVADPWWLYFSTPPDDANRLLDAWRGSVEPWGDR